MKEVRSAVISTLSKEKVHGRNGPPFSSQAQNVLPTQLLNDVRQGRAILFLGAGASRGAITATGIRAPDGRELGARISQNFLGGHHSLDPLGFVADLAMSESDPRTVQEFVATQFLGLRPTDGHRLMPSFRWRAIATTNYDMLVETAYAEEGDRLQMAVPFISNNDRIDERLRAEGSVPYLKLHGCCTQAADVDLPLILTPDQYVTHKSGRERVFETLLGWAHEYPIVFVGHALQDIDLRHLMLQLMQQAKSRPRFFMVRPDVSEEERRFWDGKRVTVVDSTFDGFMRALSAEIPEAQRRLSTLADSEHPFSRRLAVHGGLPEVLRTFLATDVDYVHEGLASQAGSPASFYKGFDLGWSAIAQNLDVRRAITDDVLNDVFLRKDVDRPTLSELVLVRAEAGAGKTVFLRRLAWEAARDADCMCFFAKESGQLDFSVFEEIHRLTRLRSFLFVDNAADNVGAIESLITKARTNAVPLTVVVAERVNEWNMGCERIDPMVSVPYQLPYLSREEALTLLELLETHKSLGSLKNRTAEQRLKDIEERAGRQLLVALHEATSGRPFELIILDEYNEIRPKLAQDIYLSVCVLNRLNVPLRAGVIARIYGVPFSDFKERLFGPLEHVVQVTTQARGQDHHYAARHAGIASIVFDRVLQNQGDRFNQYLSILGALNISYSSDREAFRALLKGRAIVDLFGDHKAALEIFAVAERIAPKEPYFFHQRGLYEMYRPNGNLDEALRFFKLARSLNERDFSILHSMAELERRRAERAKTPYERERLRKDASRLATDLMNDERSRPSARHTLVQLSIDRLEDSLASQNPSDREIGLSVQEIEKHLQRGLQENPTDSYLLTAEARYAQITSDHERAFRALEAAFSTNRRNAFVTTRLAKAYKARGNPAKAREVLEAALDANPSDMQIHYRLALELMEGQAPDLENIAYHFRRGFTPGDRNYDAQFWFARHAFESRDTQQLSEAKDVFRRLRTAALPMTYEERTRIRTKSLSPDGSVRRWGGSVYRMEASYGFVDVDGAGVQLFFHKRMVSEEVWNHLATGSRVVFSMGFTFNGPVAADIEFHGKAASEVTALDAKTTSVNLGAISEIVPSLISAM
jgi:tetratricopeptide (TPR) repeat protein/cold shock CspA family protein